MELAELSTSGFNVIDKRGKINKVTFKQIVSACKDVTIKYDKSSIKSTVSALLIELFSQSIPNDADFIVLIYQENDVYAFTGKDFNWFLKADRLKDLSTYVYGNDVFSFDDVTEQAPVTKQKPVIKQPKLFDENEYHIAVVSTKDPENLVIDDFKGRRVDCIKWLNQQIVKNANLENEVEMLICLDYDVEDPDWKSLKELFEEGKIDIC